MQVETVSAWEPRGLGDPESLPESGIVVDVRDYPLIVTHIRGKVDDAQLEAYLHCLEGLERAPRRAVMVVHMTHAMPFTAAQRKRQADWLNARDPELMERSPGVAFVVTNALIRGALRAVFWIARPRHPISVEPTLQAAKRWALGRLELGNASSGG